MYCLIHYLSSQVFFPHVLLILAKWQTAASCCDTCSSIPVLSLQLMLPLAMETCPWGRICSGPCPAWGGCNSRTCTLVHPAVSTTSSRMDSGCRPICFRTKLYAQDEALFPAKQWLQKGSWVWAENWLILNSYYSELAERDNGYVVAGVLSRSEYMTCFIALLKSI